MQKIKYLGPSASVNVGGFGPHAKDITKPYPDHVAADLLASKKQQFEPGAEDPPEPTAPPEPLVAVTEETPGIADEVTTAKKNKAK